MFFYDMASVAGVWCSWYTLGPWFHIQGCGRGQRKQPTEH